MATKRDMTVILGIGAAKPPMPKFGKRQEAPVEMPDKAAMAETPAAEREEESEEYAISPEMVCFRDAAETCGNCRHMASDGMCSVLKMKVEPGDGCNAFAQGGAGEMGAGDEKDEAAEMEAVSGLSR